MLQRLVLIEVLPALQCAGMRQAHEDRIEALDHNRRINGWGETAMRALNGSGGSRGG